MEVEKEQDEKEKRIRAITRLYYSSPKIQQVLLDFGRNREVVPRYYEGFGKRPDIIQYPSDIMGLVNKGATSFHASEEIWSDPLQLNSEITADEMSILRTSWDLLIDIDSPFLDVSGIAAKIIIKALEEHGVNNYGIKFSGNKGFHIIVSGNAFPKEYLGEEMSKAFPSWPRAICKYIMYYIRREYNDAIRKSMPDIAVIQKRTNKKAEELLKALCPNCGREGKKGTQITFLCPDCGFSIKRKDVKLTNRELRCVNCPGKLSVSSQEDYFYCEYCKTSSFNKTEEAGSGKITYTKEARKSAQDFSEDFDESISGEVLGGSDLVLVAPRHLFRMPYSLHEKTALASVVLTKGELESFSPRDADPLKATVRQFMPQAKEGEGKRLLAMALAWTQEQETEEEKELKKKYSGKVEPMNLEGVTEEMFPPAIKKLLQGLQDGKKRGLFILVAFLRSCGFSYDYTNNAIRDWNKKNEPPLKEGYIKSQIEWHFRQKRKIMPPNYDNESFYKDLGLISGKQDVKNPLVEVGRKVRKAKQGQ